MEAFTVSLSSVVFWEPFFAGRKNDFLVFWGGFICRAMLSLALIIAFCSAKFIRSDQPLPTPITFPLLGSGGFLNQVGVDVTLCWQIPYNGNNRIKNPIKVNLQFFIISLFNNRY